MPPGAGCGDKTAHNRVPARVLGGDQDHRDCLQARVFRTLAQELVPVHHWHDQVKEDHVKLLPGQHAQCLSAVAGTRHLIPAPGRGQHAHEQLLRIELILHQQYRLDRLGGEKFIQRSQQRFLRDRLDEYLGDTRRGGVITRVSDGTNRHRCVIGQRAGSQIIQTPIARKLVDHDHLRWNFLKHFTGLDQIDSLDNFHGGQVTGQQSLQDRPTFDHQSARATVDFGLEGPSGTLLVGCIRIDPTHITCLSRRGWLHRQTEEESRPRSLRLSTHSFPSCSSTKLLLMLSPRPVPPCLRRMLGSSCWKGWNSFSRSCDDIPGPVSRTLKTTASGSLHTRTYTPPSAVKRPALLSKFNNTSRIRVRSQKTGGRPASTSAVEGSGVSIHTKAELPSPPHRPPREFPQFLLPKPSAQLQSG